MILATGLALNTGAYSKSVNLLAELRTQLLGKGLLKIYGRGSGTGLNMSVSVSGITLMDDQAIPFFGTTGVMTRNDHLVFEQVINGGTGVVMLRNTTSGALTCDYIIEFIPMK